MRLNYGQAIERSIDITLDDFKKQPNSRSKSIKQDVREQLCRENGGSVHGTAHHSYALKVGATKLPLAVLEYVSTLLRGFQLR